MWGTSSDQLVVHASREKIGMISKTLPLPFSCCFTNNAIMAIRILDVQQTTPAFQQPSLRSLTQDQALQIPGKCCFDEALIKPLPKIEHTKVALTAKWKKFTSTLFAVLHAPRSMVSLQPELLGKLMPSMHWLKHLPNFKPVGLYKSG